jgi:hypothetical protein
LCEQSNKDLFFLYEDRPKIGLIREFPEKQMLRLFDKNSDPEPIYFSGKEDADREITVTAPVTNGPSNYKIKFDPHDDETWPEGKGVYALCWRDGAAYVGRGNVITRLSDHQDKWWYKPGHISHGLFWPLEDKAQRKELEEMIIETSQPLYNKQLINGRWVLFMEGEDE